MRTSPHDLLAQIAAGEGAFLELKELIFGGKQLKVPKSNALADEIAAFANAKGGNLVLGIEVATGEVLGIPLENLDSVMALVTEACHDVIDPPIDAVIEKVQLSDSLGDPRWVLLVVIGASLSIHRSPGGYYVRSGASTRKLSHGQLARLMQQRSRSGLIQYDQTTVPNTWISHLDPPLVNRFRTSRTLDSLETFALKLGMAATGARGNASLTLAGILLGTRHPERWLPNAFIQATAYRGTSVGRALDRRNYQIDAKDIYGALDHQVAEACRFVARNQRVSARKTVGRTDLPQFDMTAVFEALVNAVAHRDYSVHRAKIRLRMFSDRLEIYSPGGLVNGMRTETMAYRQSTRNEVIASLLAKCSVPEPIPGLQTSRATIMDRRGEGVPIILERSEKLSGREPRYETIDDIELLLTIFGAG